jgi:hypothetical protein
MARPRTRQYWNRGRKLAIASAAPGPSLLFQSILEEIAYELMIRSGVYKNSMDVEIRSWGSMQS